MRAKSKKKFQIKRELKTNVPEKLMMEFSEKLSIYGGRTLLSEASGIPYSTIGDMKKSGIATPKTIEAIKNGLKELKSA